jgi:hypothetical protein
MRGNGRKANSRRVPTWLLITEAARCRD